MYVSALICVSLKNTVLNSQIPEQSLTFTTSDEHEQLSGRNALKSDKSKKWGWSGDWMELNELKTAALRVDAFRKSINMDQWCRWAVSYVQTAYWTWDYEATFASSKAPWKAIKLEKQMNIHYNISILYPWIKDHESFSPQSPSDPQHLHYSRLSVSSSQSCFSSVASDILFISLPV